ncbi:MAG: DUF367 family protein [archaeon]|nr:DUF367 family protein [archaeon]
MIPVIVYDKNQCNPKKCTAKRMLKFGLAKKVNSIQNIPSGSIILSPFAKQALSPMDIEHARNGLVVVDMTWTNIDNFPRFQNTCRALPYLIASNPINWGRPMKLNSAEAVMASLIILNCKEQANEFIERFNWASEFVRLNGELLNIYAKAKNSTEIVYIQNEYLDRRMKDRSHIH